MKPIKLYNLRRCPKCRTDGGLVYCPVCHGKSKRCEHKAIRYFPDEKHAIACMTCGRLFGHLDEQENMIPHNVRG